MPSVRTPWPLLAVLALAGCGAGNPTAPDRTPDSSRPGRATPPSRPRADGGNYIGSGVKNILPSEGAASPDPLRP